MSFKASFAQPEPFEAKFTPPESVQATFSAHIEVPVADYYDGPYIVAPSGELQRLPVIGKTMRENLIIGPIPQNYGEILWDGSVIMVR